MDKHYESRKHGKLLHGERTKLRLVHDQGKHPVNAVTEPNLAGWEISQPVHGSRAFQQ